MKKICVYAICKNESKFLDRWLTSLKGADYIVVLDTGSIDGTYEMLQNDKRVYKCEQKIFSPWRFDDARNYSMTLIPEDTDICFVSDLDQVIQEGWADELRRLFDEGYNDINGDLIDFEVNSNNQKIILSRNVHFYDKNWRWLRPIHEGLEYFGDKEVKSIYSQNFVIHHMPDRQKSRDGYLDLLKDWYFDELGQYNATGRLMDPYCAMYYGCELSFHRLEHKQIFIDSLINTDYSRHEELLYQTCINIANCYIEENDYDNALIYAKKAEDCSMSTRRLYCLLGDIYFELHDYNNSTNYYYMAYNIKNWGHGWEDDEYLYNPGLIEDKLALAYYYNNDYDNAYTYGKTAFELNSDERIKNNLKAYRNKYYKVGIYAICKDESKNIERWLKTYSDADQIVVIDTGSLDNSFDLLQNHKEIFSEKMCQVSFSFGKAKDYALTKLKELTKEGHWIYCCFDLDEFIEDGGINKIKEEWEDNCDTMIAKSFDHDWWCTCNHKIHSSNSKWCWSRSIHEVLSLDGDENYSTQNSTVTYTHDRDTTKKRDYCELLEKDLEENPNDVRSAFYLCQEYYNSDKSKLIDFLDRYKEIVYKENDSYYILDYIKWNILTQENTDYWHKQRLKVMQEYNYYPRWQMYNTALYFEETRWDISEEIYFKIIATPQDSTGSDTYVSNIEVYTRLLLHDYYITKYYRRALYYAEKARDIESNELTNKNYDACFNALVSMPKKICVYAMCKNESQFVDKWLESMSEADYITVLDTGSTDGTYELLKNDKRVYRCEQKIINPWRFDVARNESLALAPEDATILISVDLDEIMESGWADDIRNNWNLAENTRGYYLYTWKHNENGDNENTFWYDKVHCPGYYWQYPVHEALVQFEHDEQYEENHAAHFNNVHLHHYPDLSKSRGSYLPLLKLRLEEDPDDFYGRLYYARELGFHDRYTEAIEQLKILLQQKDFIELKDPLVVSGAYCYIADYYRELDDRSSAIKYYLMAIERDGTYRDPYLLIAELLNELQHYNAAIGFVSDALQKTYRHYNWLERDATWREKPDDICAIAHYYLGNKEESIKYATAALAYNPTDERLQFNLDVCNKGR